MIAEIVPDAYEFGRKVLRPDLRRKGIHPTFPMGRYVSQPLAVKCDSIREVRTFLSQCKRVTDKEQFDRDDYWQPPEDFEQTKRGDCNDFALWTWRHF
jgi:predicted transglutaminase-like cysteine proteinase